MRALHIDKISGEVKASGGPVSIPFVLGQVARISGALVWESPEGSIVINGKQEPWERMAWELAGMYGCQVGFLP